MVDDATFLAAALGQERIGWAKGGIPIGAARGRRKVLATGRNRLDQMGSAIRHGETDAPDNAGRLPAAVYRRATMARRARPATCARSGAAVRHSESGGQRELRPRLFGSGSEGWDVVLEWR